MLNTPLTRSELAVLEQHFASRDGAMALAAARGYLTAVASAPTLVPTNDWLMTILGDGELADMAHANRIVGLVMRLYNGTVAALDAGQSVVPGPAASDDDVQRWCAGYMKRAQTDRAWTADPAGVELVIPIASLSCGSDMNLPDDGAPDQPMPAAVRARYRDNLASCVRAIDMYWGARRPPPPKAPTVRDAPKVGRNELCACGSGKKFKRCHAIVH